MGKHAPDEIPDDARTGISAYKPITPTNENPDLNDGAGFHRSKATIRVIIGANRSGKTECMMAELAALALGSPFPAWFNWDGDPEPPLTIWLVLNQFPANPRADARLKKLYFGERKLIDGEWTYCEPFIPKSAIACNPDNTYRNVSLHNGTTIIVKSTLQADLAMASDNVDLIVIDEPTEDEKWAEFVSRLIASPIARLIHGLTDAWLTTDYLDHVLDSEEQEMDVEQFSFTTGGNPHVDRERANKVFKLQTREQRMVRQGGMRKKTTLLCYPKILRWIDEATDREIKNPRSPTGTGNWIKPFVIPQDWTRYAIHDPGIKNAPTVWFAAEPVTNNLYAYKCCYVKNAGANISRLVGIIDRANGQDDVFTWWIDPKAAKSKAGHYTHCGEQATIDVYRAASEQYGIKWVLAPPKLENMYRDHRIHALTAYLDPQDDSAPMMYFFDVKDGLDPDKDIHGMDFLKYDFKRYRRNEQGKPIHEYDHGPYCCEAAAAMKLRYRGSPSHGGGWQRMIRPASPLQALWDGQIDRSREAP